MHDESVERLLQRFEIVCDCDGPKPLILAAAAREMRYQRRARLVRYAAAACLLISLGFGMATYQLERDIARVTPPTTRAAAVTTDGLGDIHGLPLRRLRQARPARGRILARYIHERRSVMSGMCVQPARPNHS